MLLFARDAVSAAPRVRFAQVQMPLPELQDGCIAAQKFHTERNLVHDLQLRPTKTNRASDAAHDLWTESLGPQRPRDLFDHALYDQVKKHILSHCAYRAKSQELLRELDQVKVNIREETKRVKTWLFKNRVPSVLFLCGGPGIGKHTAVRVAVTACAMELVPLNLARRDDLLNALHSQHCERVVYLISHPGEGSPLWQVLSKLPVADHALLVVVDGAWPRGWSPKLVTTITAYAAKFQPADLTQLVRKALRLVLQQKELAKTAGLVVTSTSKQAPALKVASNPEELALRLLTDALAPHGDMRQAINELQLWLPQGRPASSNGKLTEHELFKYIFYGEARQDRLAQFCGHAKDWADVLPSMVHLNLFVTHKLPGDMVDPPASELEALNRCGKVLDALCDSDVTHVLPHHVASMYAATSLSLRPRPKFDQATIKRVWSAKSFLPPSSTLTQYDDWDRKHPRLAQALEARKASQVATPKPQKRKAYTQRDLSTFAKKPKPAAPAKPPKPPTAPPSKRRQRPAR